MIKLRMTEEAIQALADIHHTRIDNKIKEYKAKPELLEAKLTVEKAGLFKEFSKRYGVKLAHFRVGDDRVIGLLKKDVLSIVGFTTRGKLQRNLERIAERFPFDLK